MSLLEELKIKRVEAQENVNAAQDEASELRAREWFWANMVADLDTAIAALEPAPAERDAETQDRLEAFKARNPGFDCSIIEPATIDYTEQDGTRSQQELEDIAPAQPDPPSAELRSDPGSQHGVESEPTAWVSSVPDMTRTPTNSSYRIISQPADQSDEESAGFTKWEGWLPWGGGECPVDGASWVEFYDRNGGPFVECAMNVQWAHAYDPVGAEVDIIRYRPCGAPSTDEITASADDVRNDSQQDEGAGERADQQSVLDNPELTALAERAEATLAAADDDEIFSRAAYVGLQDPELDADWDAMKERQEAGKKLHFSIFGKREDA